MTMVMLAGWVTCWIYPWCECVTRPQVCPSAVCCSGAQTWVVMVVTTDPSCTAAHSSQHTHQRHSAVTASQGERSNSRRRGKEAALSE